MSKFMNKKYIFKCHNIIKQFTTPLSQLLSPSSRPSHSPIADSVWEPGMASMLGTFRKASFVKMQQFWCGVEV